MTVITTDAQQTKAQPEKTKRAERTHYAGERRKHARLPFTAGTKAVEPDSQAEIEAHTTDLSAQGCYVDTMNPFPSGTEMHLRLTKDGRSFHTKARVIYCQTGRGMGLLFTQMAPAQHSVLEKWFAELRGECRPDAEIEDIDRCGVTKLPHGEERYAIADLVSLLTEKHLLTEDEGDKILRRLDQ